jgi:hypothetical protein
MAWSKRNAPCLLLGAALLSSAVLLLSLQSNLTFFQDTWAFLMHRRELDADALLQPHNEHIVLIPVMIENLLIAVFGMTTARPEQVVMTLVLLASATLLFVYVRRRIGAWPALFAAVLLLFVGPAWQVLIWPFEVGFAGSVLFGIAMLLALDRGDRDSDLAACAFLALSIGFASLGVAFAAGAAVDVLLRRRSHGLRRAYVPAIPLALYAAWWLGWGHTAQSHVSLDNVIDSPVYLLEGFVASIESLLGVSTVDVAGNGGPAWGWPILIALLALLGVRLARGGRISPRVWPVLTVGVVFWLLAAFNYIPSREAHASRYMYAGGAFVLLIAADLLRGVRFGRPALVLAAAVTVAATLANLSPLRDGRDVLREQTVLTRADLAAIEIARRTVDSNFALLPEIAGTASLIDVQVGNYLDAVEEHGSPAYTPAELVTAPPLGRVQADIVLAQALPLSTEKLPGTDSRARGRCATVMGRRGPGAAEVRLRPGVTGIEVKPGPDAELSLRRFATAEHPVSTEPIPGDSTTLLRIPRDAVARPWFLRIEAAQPVRVCR